MGSKRDKRKDKKNRSSKPNAAQVSKESDDEDIDQILQQFEQQQREKFQVIQETDAQPPSARCNATMISNPLNPSELLLFGGEFYDGNKVYMYNDLYKYKTDKNKWIKITSANAPGPRSSHQCIAASNGYMYLFGGEYVSSNETKFFHYKDFWHLNLKTNEWEKIESTPKPSPRSGHRMCLWKNFIVLFGGFYDVGKEIKYHDDLWLFNTLDYTWKKVDLSDPKPSARSGFQLLSHQDTIILYGGYCKKTDSKKEIKGITYTDVWRLEMGDKMKWEKLKNTGELRPKSGCTMTYYKGKGVMFGGVTDTNVEEDRIQSVCLNEIIQGNRWLPLKNKASTNVASDETGPGEPHARFNTMLAVVKNNLWLYGGILEIEAQDYTLGDLWTIQLDKMNGWTCMLQGDLPVAQTVDSSDESASKDEDSDDQEGDSSDEEESPSDSLAPLTGESLREYYTRTSDHWEAQMTSECHESAKELRKQAFAMAKEHYDQAQL